MAEIDDTEQDHHEIVRRRTQWTWPAEKSFPLTPLEAWYVRQGWEVKPAAGITATELVDAMPGKLEGGNGWILPWQP
jgi:hypothetical protein